MRSDRDAVAGTATVVLLTRGGPGSATRRGLRRLGRRVRRPATGKPIAAGARANRPERGRGRRGRGLGGQRRRRLGLQDRSADELVGADDPGRERAVRDSRRRRLRLGHEQPRRDRVAGSTRGRTRPVADDPGRKRAAGCRLRRGCRVGRQFDRSHRDARSTRARESRGTRFRSPRARTGSRSGTGRSG